MTPAVELRGVRKTFGVRGAAAQTPAVDGIDMAVEAGEFFSVLGPSGCGKTTTMRMIAGFAEPTEGEVLLHGRNVVGVPPNRRDVNMVFQSYALFPHLNVLENVAFGLRRQKLPKAEVVRRVGTVLDLVELTGRERRVPRELSGGQQQRVALARALVNNPRALLLDEPLGALDLKLRQSMQVELKRIQREIGITFVYVTHDQGEALTMSDRIAVMNGGRVEQLGPPREIYERPATRFVASFIGTSNLLTGRVTRVERDTAVIDVGDGQRMLLPLEGAPVHAGDSVDLAVRPEKIDLLTAPPPATDGNLLRGTVTEVVYFGNSTTYSVTVSTGAEIVVFVQNASSAEDAAARGDGVWLSWRPHHSFRIAGPQTAAPPDQNLAAPVPGV